MTEYFEFQNLFSLSVIGGGVRARGGGEGLIKSTERWGCESINGRAHFSAT